MDNPHLQNTRLYATLPSYARELIANLMFCFWAALFSCKCKSVNLIFNGEPTH